MAAAVAVTLLLIWLFGLRLALRVPGLQHAARERIEQGLSSRLGTVHLEGPVRAGVGLRFKLGPLTVGNTHWLRIESLTVQPAWLPLFAGKAVLDSVDLQSIRIRVNDELLTLVRSRPSTVPGTPSSNENGRRPSVSFSDLWIEMPPSTWLAGRWGPFGGELDQNLNLQLPDGGQVQLEKLPGGKARVLISDVQVRSSRWLGERARRLDASVLLNGSADLQETNGLAELRLSLRAEEGSLFHPRISRAPLKELSAEIDANFSLSAKEKTIRLVQAELRLGSDHAVKVGLTGVFTAKDEPRGEMHVQLAPITYAQLSAALQGELLPDARSPQFAGTIQADARWTGTLHRPDDWMLDAKLDLTDARQKSENARTLAQEFSYVATTAAGSARTVVVGPSNPHYVPKDELPPHVWRSVLASEDAGFFLHPGFDFGEFRNSVVDALMRRRYRGASTLTQQLAKNLYVSSEPTLARKIREAVTTLSLEATVSKDRLLEVYLNAVEWGPGIYGIGAAAQHYFGKDARDLTLKEGAVLATFLPSPARYHGYHLRGLSDVWEQRLTDLLTKMHEQGAVTDEEYNEAMQQTLEFLPTCDSAP